MLSIDIVPNKEFYGRMLLYGDDIEVVSPSDVREQVKSELRLCDSDTQHKWTK